MATIRKFDTKVQHLKYKVLREVAREAWNDYAARKYTRHTLPHCPGKYSDHALLRLQGEGYTRRSRQARDGRQYRQSECHRGHRDRLRRMSDGRYEVTNACRGCLAHRCEDVCRKGAITFDAQHVAHIDKTKCVDCGQCAKVCPYTAIIKRTRPCENACKVKAISMNENKAAKINNEKCTACGACVYQCPFGAITDKSYILDVIDIIKKKRRKQKLQVVRDCRSVDIEPVQICEARTGHNRS